MPFSRVGVQLAMTVAGSVYLTGGVLLTLWWLGIVTPIPSLLSTELLPYLAVAFVALSYMCGIIAYEAVIISLRPLSLLTEKLFAWRNLRVSRNDVPGQVSDFEVEVWQHGSERLTHELDAMVANLWLIRLLLVGLPFLGLSILLWTQAAGLAVQGRGLAVMIWACTGVLVAGHRNQVRRTRAFLKSAHAVLRTAP